MKIGVTAPIYINNENHRDFLDGTTRSIRSEDHDIYWIPVENFVNDTLKPLGYVFNQEPKEIIRLIGRQPQSVAKGWNDGIQAAMDIGCDYILVINADIVLRDDAIDKIIEFAEAHPEFAMWSMGQTSDLFGINTCVTDENWSEHPNFSAYLIKKDFWKYVGKFDENYIPAYYEDNDMHGRLVLAKQKAVIYGGARFFHFGSRTKGADVELQRSMPAQEKANLAYFITKFGRHPSNEPLEMRSTYFPTPFNDPEKTLADW